jgi:transcription initiation factor TFIID TATA-box-binding protein
MTQNKTQYQSKLRAKIQSVITTADLKQKVDATRFINYPWGTYDIAFYGGLCGYVKDETIQGRVTVFLSGKMISTGAKSVQGSVIQLEKAMNLLAKDGFVKTVKLIPKTKNIVATLDIGSRIDLNEVVTHVPKITFEPDQFPGAILRMTEGPVCLLFASGKIVIAGSKSVDDIRNAVSNLEKMLRPFHIEARNMDED